MRHVSFCGTWLAMARRQSHSALGVRKQRCSMPSDHAQVDQVECRRLGALKLHRIAQRALIARGSFSDRARSMRCMFAAGIAPCSAATDDTRIVRFRIVGRNAALIYPVELELVPGNGGEKRLAGSASSLNVACGVNPRK